MDNELTIDQLQQMVATTAAEAVNGALKAREEAEEKARKALEAQEIAAKAAKADEAAAEATRLAAENAALKAKLEERQNTPRKHLPGDTGEPSAPDARKTSFIKVGSPYDNLNAVDMAHGYLMMRGVKGFSGVSEQYAKALAEKTVKGYETAMKSDELSYSTQASYGDEWVPDLWSAELWRAARLNNSILPLFQSIDMPSNPYELPIEGTDPTVSYVGETTDEADLLISGSGAAIPDSKIGSGKAQLSAKKLALRVGFSSELVEDSIVPVLSMYREQAMRAMMDAIDNVLLNGDTTNEATGNINLDDADPTDTNKYLAFNGLRHLWIVTTTANGVNAAGAPTLALIRQARFTMAGKFSVNPSNLAMICDASTYAKLLSLDEVITVDKFGPQATVLNGQLASIDGMPIIVSAEAGLTEADGKISTTAGNNTKGQITIAYRPGWYVGYKRRIAASMDYIPYYDAYQMTATLRLGFINFDADVSAGLYNITV